MPYDSIKARELLRVGIHHRSQPNGDYVMQIIELLTEAEAAIGKAQTEARDARLSADDLSRRLDLEAAAHSELRARVATAASIEELRPRPKKPAKIAPAPAAAVVPPTETAAPAAPTKPARKPRAPKTPPAAQ